MFDNINRSKQIYCLEMYLIHVVQMMSVFLQLIFDIFNTCTKLHKFSSFMTFEKGMQAVFTGGNCGTALKFQFFKLTY